MGHVLLSLWKKFSHEKTASDFKTIAFLLEKPTRFRIFSREMLILTCVFAFWGTSVFGQSQESIIPCSDSISSITKADFSALSTPSMRWATQDFSKDPSVVRFQDCYWLYFTFPRQELNGQGSCFTIGIAKSSDLTNWELVANLLPMQECDQKGLCAPCAKVFGDKVFLFYQSYGGGALDAICCAWSEDGVHFTPHPQNPIFRPQGTWTNGRAIDADMIPFHDQWFLYAATRDPEGKIQKLTVATAKILDPQASDPVQEFSPERWQLGADASILEPTQAWETRCIEAPTVLERDGILYMFYAGGYNNDPQQIGLAVSQDGLHWTRVWNVPFLPNGPQGQWNESESGHPGIFVDQDAQTWLFFQGNKTHGKDWYLSRVKIGWIPPQDTPQTPWETSPGTFPNVSTLSLPHILNEQPGADQTIE